MAILFTFSVGNFVQNFVNPWGKLFTPALTGWHRTVLNCYLAGNYPNYSPLITAFIILSQLPESVLVKDRTLKMLSTDNAVKMSNKTVKKGFKPSVKAVN
ncbi:hypothetical protein ACFFJN_17330 [Erwinia mallotivora]|uniref:hypothetical protein n=1 Tax=Erwinia mallotivora TaxID=69222 RepID=UPI0035E671FB